MPIRLLFALFLLLATPAAAAAQDVGGSWALRVEGAAIFRFDIEQDGSGWRAVWTRPMAMNSDGLRFGNFSKQAVEVPSSVGNSFGEWAELTFPDPRPNGVPDVFRFRLVNEDRIEMIYGGTGWAPFSLDRVEPGTALGPFEIGKYYARGEAPPLRGSLPVLFSHPEAEFPQFQLPPPVAVPETPEDAEERPPLVGR